MTDFAFATASLSIQTLRAANVIFAATDIAPYGFDAVIDATGVPSVVENAVQPVKRRGKFLLFGVCPEDSKIPISPFEIYRRDLTVIGTFALRYSFDPALELIRNGAGKVKPLLNPLLTLERIPAMFKHRTKNQNTIKITVTVQVSARESKNLDVPRLDLSRGN